MLKDSFEHCGAAAVASYKSCECGTLAHQNLEQKNIAELLPWKVAEIAWNKIEKVRNWFLTLTLGGLSRMIVVLTVSGGNTFAVVTLEYWKRPSLTLAGRFNTLYTLFSVQLPFSAFAQAMLMFDFFDKTVYWSCSFFWSSMDEPDETICVFFFIFCRLLLPQEAAIDRITIRSPRPAL